MRVRRVAIFSIAGTQLYLPSLVSAYVNFLPIKSVSREGNTFSATSTLGRAQYARSSIMFPPRQDLPGIRLRPDQIGSMNPLGRPCRLDMIGTVLPSATGFGQQASEVSVLQLPQLKDPDVAVIWFTASDLRVHDHDGLVAAGGAAGVIPLYVFDDQELGDESFLDAKFTYYAVRELRRALRRVGTDLVVRSGDAAVEVPRIVREIGASHVFYHRSPVHALRRSHSRVEAALRSLEADTGTGVPGQGGLGSQSTNEGSKGQIPGPPGRSVSIHSWSASQLTGVDPLDPSTAWNFRDFERTFGSGSLAARAAFPAPVSLPPIPASLHPGDFPELDGVLARVGSQDTLVREGLSVAGREEAPFGSMRLCVEGFGEARALQILDDYLTSTEEDFARGVFGSQEGEDTGGEAGLEAAATQRIVRARGYAGLAPGEVLARAIGVALALGCLSPRRLPVLDANGETFVAANVSPSSHALCVAVAPAKPASDLCDALRLVDQGGLLICVDSQGDDGSMEFRYLRWHGWLVRYAVGGSKDPSDPALLLVHGFGASCDQWDEVFRAFSPSSSASQPLIPPANDEPAAERATGEGDRSEQGAAALRRGTGVRLAALDLAGFGHSAKPPLTYSQYFWSDCARDVALRVIRGPFFVAGNSIGGFCSMGVAAESRDLCRGLVLVNSAGRILNAEQFEEEMSSKFDGLTVEAATRRGRLGTYSAPPNLVLRAFGTGLMMFLQGRIAETCRNVYPVNPGIVDEGLSENILRDSCDPGAACVIAAGGKLPFSRSVNEMLGKFGGPVLVTQGVKDPLNDAEGRAQLFGMIGSQVDVVRLDGGHCPHHEIADEVCVAVSGFIERVVEDRRRGGEQ